MLSNDSEYQSGQTAMLISVIQHLDCLQKKVKLDMPCNIGIEL